MLKQFYCILFIFLLAHHTKCTTKRSPNFQNNFASIPDEILKLIQSFEKDSYVPKVKEIIGTLIQLLQKLPNSSPTNTIPSVSVLSMIYTAYEFDRLSLLWDSIKNAENVIFEGELRLEKIQQRIDELYNDLNERAQYLLDYEKTSDIKERQGFVDKIDHLTKKMHETCLDTKEVLENLSFKINGATVSMTNAKNSQMNGMVWSVVFFVLISTIMLSSWCAAALYYKFVMMVFFVVSLFQIYLNVQTYQMTQDTLRQLDNVTRQIIQNEIELDEVFLKIKHAKEYVDYLAKTNLRNQNYKSEL